MSRGLLIPCLIVAMGAAVYAIADASLPPVANETVRSECGDCHISYQPQMLPQRSWRRLLDGLGDHFGEELSLEGDSRQEVLRYLLDNAADVSTQKQARKFLRDLGSGDDPIRITDACEVCHTKAEQGLYDDDDGLRVPGPGGTWRRWEDD